MPSLGGASFELRHSRTTPVRRLIRDVKTGGPMRSYLLCRFRGEEVGGRHRNLPQTDTRGIKDGIADGGSASA